ncbi:hypothetical protein J7M02_05750 [Candidatus Aerophobetes bacterium]|nr:hypothetical protein [Candidatus Aerophobetes bacterium]
MRKVKINLSELMDAFENCRSGYEFYLDTKTGELLYTSDEFMDPEETKKIYERMEDEPERYLSVPERSSREGYQDMVAFTESLEDEDLQEKLWIALNGRGAFRRFKDVLLNYPEKREEWFAFKDERLERRVMDWLEENGIELA